MKPEFKFETMRIMTGNFGKASCLPSFLGTLTLQNKVNFDLDEWDEIYEGYGRTYSCYPYTELNSYNRSLSESQIKTAVLENNHLKAVFLPTLGGRLWSLTDKHTGQNLLYTNDVIRFSNLAVRDAWFSGGVEWNIGIIGHSPLTTESLHTAQLTDDHGNPVLRMYAYERIREVEYQMDFWLGPEDSHLNCRMRIVNSSSEVVPMYWWSNMAVPEYAKGRIVVPAREAYTCGMINGENKVHKVSVPIVNGIDISNYTTIPNQVDYFFNIPKDAPKYITNLDASGYGLLHVSTDRLQGRKLFSWGNNDGSNRWQEFLTHKAGRYVEIQAGLAKTQYGCLPMAPHTAWEWIEHYGPVQLPASLLDASFEVLQNHMTGLASAHLESTALVQTLEHTKTMAKTPGTPIYYGTPYGTLKSIQRNLEQGTPLSPHLDYGPLTGELKDWADFIVTGIFPQSDPLDQPKEFQKEGFIYEKLIETIDQPENRDNWYAHYHLGLMHLYYKAYAEAEHSLRTSLKLAKTPWVYHGLAVLSLILGNKSQCRHYIISGLRMMTTTLSYVKEGFHLLLIIEAYKDICTLYPGLSPQLQKESRIYFDYLTGLAHTGHSKEAFDALNADGGLILDDVRECTNSLWDLYATLYEQLYHKKPEGIPHHFNFHSIDF